MTLHAEYPASRYAPSPLVDLTTKADRERLSPSAVRAFFNIVDRSYPYGTRRRLLIAR